MGIRRNKTILEQASDYVEAAVDKAGPILADAKDRAEAALSDARDQAGPVLAQGAALAADKASQAAEVAAEKASQGKELATAKAAELTGKPPKKKHRLRTLLVVTGIAAALGFVAKKLSARRDQDNWQTSPTPPPPPPARGSSDDSADQGGAGPDEALADAVDEAHQATTPDEPADVVDLAPGEEPVATKRAKP